MLVTFKDKDYNDGYYEYQMEFELTPKLKSEYQLQGLQDKENFDDDFTFEDWLEKLVKEGYIKSYKYIDSWTINY